MSVELVTGYSGVGSGGEPNRHVSSEEDGARQAGTVGLGCYVLSTGSKLSATMEDANTLVVSDGDVMMNGRHVSLPDPTSFTIPTGVQGQKVSNLAVLRYEKAADSVESVTPVVLTGEPSTGTPTDPAYNDGSILDGDSPVDMPLYRVVTNGVNAGDPVPLFDVMMPMSELWDSVSQANSTAGTANSTAQSAQNTANTAVNKLARIQKIGFVSVTKPNSGGQGFVDITGSDIKSWLEVSDTAGKTPIVLACNGDFVANNDLSIRTIAINTNTWDTRIWLGQVESTAFRLNLLIGYTTVI